VGRKDSKTASFELAASNLPTADEGLLSIMTKFLYQGLSATDLVALSGRMLGSVIFGNPA
jgi:peroxidase